MKDEQQFKLLVIIIEGEKRIWIDVVATDTIATVKAKIQHMEGIPVDDQVISSLFLGPLQDDRTLKSYGLSDESWIHCVKDGLR